jgi:chaperonin cofactor prefoldin
MLGGPVGIAAGLGITAAITGFMLYKKAAEEARERAIAAFADPVKTAEYFGENIKSVTQQFSDMAVSAEEAGLNAGEIDQGLREAVKQDYAPLIENLQRTGTEVGARELSNTFNKMIASGLSAEEAKASVEAIAVEAGVNGGQAFARAMGEGMLGAASTLDAMLSFRSTAAGGESALSAQESILQSAQARRDRSTQGRLVDKLDGQFRGGTAFGRSDYLRDAQELSDLTTTSSDELIKAAEFYFQTFTEAPKEAIKLFDEIAATTDETFNADQVKEYLVGIDKVAGERLSAMIDSNAADAKEVLRALSAGISLPEIIAAVEAGALDAEIQIRIDTRQAEVDLQNLKNSISEALGADLTKKLEVTDNKIEGLDKQIGRVEKSLEKGTEKLQENFEATQEASDAAIEAMQDESDLIQEKIDKRREETQEKIDSLNKEKDGIVEATDAYINSIQKRLSHFVQKFSSIFA